MSAKLEYFGTGAFRHGVASDDDGWFATFWQGREADLAALLVPSETVAQQLPGAEIFDRETASHAATPREADPYVLLEMYQDDTRYQLCQRIANASLERNQKERENAELREENKRILEIGKGFERDSRATFSQSCLNLQRAKTAESQLAEAMTVMRGLIGLVQLIASGDGSEHKLNHRYVDADVLLTAYESQNAK